MRLAVRLLTLLTCVAIAATASAQFGHPLKGSWSGDWGPDKTNRAHVLLDIGWDGKVLNAVLNPGANGTPLKTTLDPSTWTVKFEGDGKDKAGKTVHVTIDGKLVNLGAFQRVMTGTWTEGVGNGAVKGDFKLTRN